MTVFPRDKLPRSYVDAAATQKDSNKKTLTLVLCKSQRFLSFLDCLQDFLYQLIPAVALFGGEGNHRGDFRQLQIPANGF